MRSEPFVSVCISSISKGSNIRLSLVQVMNWKGGWLSMWQWMIPLRWRGRYWMVGVYTTRLGSEIGLTIYNHVKWWQEMKMSGWPWSVHKFKRDLEAKRLGKSMHFVKNRRQTMKYLLSSSIYQIFSHQTSGDMKLFWMFPMCFFKV